MGSLTERLRALVGFVPVGLDRLVRAATWDRVTADVVRPLVWLLLLVGVLAPLIVAGASRLITDVTPSDMVERAVPTDITLVSMFGLAMPLNVQVPPGERATTDVPEYLYLVRDPASERRLVMVRTTDPPDQLMRRIVIARVADEGGQRILVETDPADASVRDVGTVDDALGQATGTLVRIGLIFSGEGTPTCANTAAGCGRTLASGTGVFDQVANGPTDGAEVNVRTTYPPTAAPATFTGPQVRDQTLITDALGRPSLRVLAGWARVLSTTYVQDDPNLPVHRLWWGPIICGVLAVLLWLGRRIGYPLFQPTADGSLRWVTLDTGGAPRRVRITASGHISPPGSGPVYLDEEAGELVPPGREQAIAILELARQESRLPLAMPANTGTLGSIERGHVIGLGRRGPALWIHWFGTDLRLVFDSDADRDMAAAAIGR